MYSGICRWDGDCLVDGGGQPAGFWLSQASSRALQSREIVRLPSVERARPGDVAASAPRCFCLGVHSMTRCWSLQHSTPLSQISTNHLGERAGVVIQPDHKGITRRRGSSGLVPVGYAGCLPRYSFPLVRIVNVLDLGLTRRQTKSGPEMGHGSCSG